MATFTLQHSADDDCKVLKLAVASAWKRMLAGAPWQRMKAQYFMVGFVRGIEVTHGENGWHPHLHVLILTGRKLLEAEELQLGERLFGRWQKMVEKNNGKAERSGFDFVKSGSNAAAEYVSKWGAACEISKGVDKLGNGTMSPWQMLDAASRGDERAGELFLEYAAAFHGARHLTYSVGLRARYELDAAATDEELIVQGELDVNADDVGEIYRFDKGAWADVCKKGLTGRVLHAGRSGGRNAVEALLNAHGLTSSMNPVRPPRWWTPSKPLRGVLTPMKAGEIAPSLRKRKYAYEHENTN